MNAKAEKTSALLHIVETTIGYYAYHLSETGRSGALTLCGISNVMSTQLRLGTWNSEPTHIRSKYCKACHDAARDSGVLVPNPSEKTLVF